MLLIQLIILTFAAFALLRAGQQFRAGQLPMGWLLFWVAFWLGVAGVTILPQTTDIAARFVGVGRGVDLMLYVSVVGLFYLVFRLFVKIEQGERELTRLVRTLALKEMNRSSETHVIARRDDEAIPHR